MEKEIKKLKRKAEVKDLETAFKGTLVTDIDKMRYINFRYPGARKIIFYCIARKEFVTVYTRYDASKSGWKSQRLFSKADVKTFVESIKAQLEQPVIKVQE